MPRPPNPEVHTRLLVAGRELMLDRGFHGSGVNELAARAGVPKGSFYSYFPSKDAFVVAVLKDYWAWVEGTFGPKLVDADRPAADRLAQFFAAMAEDNERHDFGHFCLVGSLALEMAGGSPATRATVADILARWRSLLADCVAAAPGHAAGRDPGETADLLIEAWEGAVLRSKVDRTPAACHRFVTVTLPRLLA